MYYWAKANERSLIAKKHTELMENTKTDLIKSSVAESKIYESCAVQAPTVSATFKLLNTDSVSAIMMQDGSKRTGVLNFASFKEPGGKFLEGSSAQEESLCHKSFLYNVLKEFKDSYYDINKKCLNRALYLDKALYTPNIEFEQDNNARFADVITCATPNWTAANKYCHVTPLENYRVLSSRIKFVKDIACDNNLDVIILGAYGCGVFGQDPETVAKLIHQHFKSSIPEVILAVPGKDKNYQAFANYFKDFVS